MKAFCTLVSILFTTTLFAQSLDGSWQLTHENGELIIDREVIAIYQDGYFAVGAKKGGSNAFLYAKGGEFTHVNGLYTETHDFNTKDKDNIGKKQQFAIKVTKDEIVITARGTQYTWQRLSGKKDTLTRNWVITGRERNGQMNTMTPGDRRTVKILSGGRFQWIAFNSATKEFSGTGGGTYTAQNGVYTENITFFSRDDSRVGASLQFQYEVKDGKWHHKGKSSKGEPIYEIWSPYNKAYKK